MVFDSLKIQSCRLTCSFPEIVNYADLKVNFYFVNSHFCHESINLNFPLVSVIFATLLRLSGRLTKKRRCHGTDLKKEKHTKKANSDLLCDSLKIQSCRLTCSFPDNLNYAYFDFFQFFRCNNDSKWNGTRLPNGSHGSCPSTCIRNVSPERQEEPM